MSPHEPGAPPAERAKGMLDPARSEDFYRDLRRQLVRYFQFHRCEDPDDLAQEVLMRGLKRVSEGVTVFAADPRSFSFGIARHVVQETHHRHREQLLSPEAWDAQPAQTCELQRREAALVLKRMLDTLPEDERDLIVRYHTEDREALARALGISEGALRVRAHRIRRKLEDFRAGLQSP